MKKLNEHWRKVFWHLTGLVRTRVVICMIGLVVMNHQPSIAQWVVSICGLALGVSAIDAWKGVKYGRDIDGDSK